MFAISWVSFPWKRTWPFLWLNWNPHYPRMLCAKFGWNKAVDSGEFFLNSFNIFTHFRTYLPLEKGVTLYFNKFESPLPKEALCQVWLKLTQWFHRFLISSMYFRYFIIIFSWKRMWPFVSTNLNPRLCAKFSWNMSSGSWEENKSVKSSPRRQRRRQQTILIRIAHTSLRLSWAKKSYFQTIMLTCQMFCQLVR